MAHPETVFWFSQLSDMDIWKCLDYYRRHHRNPLAGVEFTKYSSFLEQPRLARALMRGFLNVESEKETVKIPLSEIYAKQAQNRFQARLIKENFPPTEVNKKVFRTAAQICAEEVAQKTAAETSDFTRGPWKDFKGF